MEVNNGSLQKGIHLSNTPHFPLPILKEYLCWYWKLPSLHLAGRERTICGAAWTGHLWSRFGGRKVADLLDTFAGTDDGSNFFWWLNRTVFFGALFDSGLNPPHKAGVGFRILMFFLDSWGLRSTFVSVKWIVEYGLMAIAFDLEALRSCIAILFKVQSQFHSNFNCDLTQVISWFIMIRSFLYYLHLLTTYPPEV